MFSDPVFNATTLGAGISAFETLTGWSQITNWKVVFGAVSGIQPSLVLKNPVITKRMNIGSLNTGNHSVRLRFKYVD